MKRGASFWLRVTAALFVASLVCMVPAIFFPFGLSLILAVLLKPLADFIARLGKRGGRCFLPYDLAIVLSFILFIGILYLIGQYVLVPFIKEFREFIASIPQIVATVQQAAPRLIEQYQLNAVPPEVKQLIASTIEKIGSYTLGLASLSLSAAFSFASTMIELIVVPIITFYMIKSGGAFCHGFIGLFPERYEKHLTLLFQEIHFVLSAYIRGQLTLSVLMTLIVFLGMVFLDIPYPLVIGLLAGIVEMVPVIGPIMGAVPPVLLGLAQSSAVMLQVLAFYIVVQQLDSHIVMPKLMGSIIKVHPVAIILGVLVGGHLYGVVGMMISVPVLAVLQVLLRHMWFYNRYREACGK